MIRSRRVITTADDFGLSLAVNEAVERAARQGVLGGASLMVGEPAAADAVERARGFPRLRVGLHVVVADGTPVLAPQRIPDLCDDAGRLDGRLVRAGVRFFFSATAARQLAAEIAAQFAAFARTGLSLDHVNAHKHMHLHPTVMRLIMEAGRGYGMRAMRLPYEPFDAGDLSVADRLAKTAATCITAPWTALMRRRMRQARLRHNDFVFGLTQSGAMDERAVLGILGRLPEGISEIYFHPVVAAQGGLELAALLSPRVQAALGGAGIERTSFSDLD
ncbi:MAG: hopanoid biosynthesis-associated protein HpnK [Acidiferrobacter sp.]